MKKDFRNYPFMEGDTVYHFSHGKGVVTYTTEGYVHVMFDDGERALTQFAIELLSFTPYEINSDWERPYEPKDGDIVFESDRIIIINNAKSLSFHALAYPSLETLIVDGINNDYYHGGIHEGLSFRPATPEEAQTLFDALEKEGWRWNAEKKELEKMPVRPKEGDLVIAWDGNPRDAAICTLLHVDGKGLSTTKVGVRHCCFENIVKFESMEQFEKIRRGEV